jgi:FeS assembly SUF system regulator
MSKETDYGIILMTYFASRRGKLRSSAREVARDVGLPSPMVSKILKVLTRGDLLVSHRGARGGYSLARAKEQISVAEIINALEGPVAMTECIESPGECRHEPICGLRSTWEQINGLVLDSLSGISLTELVGPAPKGGNSELVHLQ